MLFIPFLYTLSNKFIFFLIVFHFFHFNQNLKDTCNFKIVLGVWLYNDLLFQSNQNFEIIL